MIGRMKTMGSAKEKLLGTGAVLFGVAVLFLSRGSLDKGTSWNHFVGLVLGMLLAQITLIGYSSGQPGTATISTRGVVLVASSVVLLAVAVEFCWFYVVRASIPGWSDFGKLFIQALSACLIYVGVFLWLPHKPRHTETN
ncbi:MAG: hypothetical protein ABSG84_08640 [Acidobacteriaceae bacterium]|jgi:hypothetical protein